jgi:hypothetical protein
VIAVITHSTAGLDARMNMGIAAVQALTAVAGMGFLAWTLCSVTVARPHTTVGTEPTSVEMVASLSLVSVSFRLPHLGFRP